MKEYLQLLECTIGQGGIHRERFEMFTRSWAGFAYEGHQHRLLKIDG